MTKEQIAEYKQKGEYGNIILAANLILIGFYIILFNFKELSTILGNKYRFKVKQTYNRVYDVIDRICADSINFFKDGKNNAGQNCIDLCIEIEDLLSFEDKSLYIIYVVNEYIHNISSMYPKNVHSIYENEIEYVYKTLISNLPIELNAHKMLAAKNAVDKILSRVKYRIEEDTTITIIYVNEDSNSESNLYKDSK